MVALVPSSLHQPSSDKGHTVREYYWATGVFCPACGALVHMFSRKFTDFAYVIHAQDLDSINIGKTELHALTRQCVWCGLDLQGLHIPIIHAYLDSLCPQGRHICWGFKGPIMRLLLLRTDEATNIRHHRKVSILWRYTTICGLPMT